MEYYFENPNGDTNENISFLEIKKAIANLKEMQEEHPAFWMGDQEGIAVLEVHKDLRLFVIIEAEEKQFSIQLASEKEVEDLFELFMANNLDAVLKVLDEKTKNV